MYKFVQFYLDATVYRLDAVLHFDLKTACSGWWSMWRVWSHVLPPSGGRPSFQFLPTIQGALLFPFQLLCSALLFRGKKLRFVYSHYTICHRYDRNIDRRAHCTGDSNNFDLLGGPEDKNIFLPGISLYNTLGIIDVDETLWSLNSLPLHCRATSGHMIAYLFYPYFICSIVIYALYIMLIKVVMSFKPPLDHLLV